MDKNKELQGKKKQESIENGNGECSEKQQRNQRADNYRF